MRTVVLIAVSALAIAGCDAKNPFAKSADKPAAPAVVAVAPPPAPEAAAPAPAAADAAAPTAAEVAAQPAAARPEPRVDYSKRERRLAALIANAETRDTSGETQHRAEMGRAQRARCATRACVESSYASEETWLRQWEGSGEGK